MAWLWDSWEECVGNVQPVMVDSPGLLRLAHRESRFETDCRIWKAAEKLEEASHSLQGLGFTGKDHDRPPADPAILDKTYRLTQDAVQAGEELLLYHKRLAKSDASYGFLHQNDVLEHWDRYAAARRIFSEIHQLIKDIDGLLQGYYQFVQAEDRFILGALDLPSSLEADFRLARNLFSVGFDEVGLLIAGRGLEGVLRKVAQMRKIVLDVKGRLSPASEADFSDLIETMSQVRWKATGVRLVSPQVKTLLHFLRTIRNASAHPQQAATPPIGSSREIATVVAETASQLWNQVESTRARLAPSIVPKNW